MKGIVVGLGSMGKRRIRLMKRFFPEIELVGVDSRQDRREETSRLFGVRCCESLEGAGGADCGFVCTSPLSHASVISSMLERGLNVFTEINLVSDGYRENTALAREKGLTLFLSSTPLYRRETQYIESAVRREGRPVVYRYHVGQYLPDWHPWESYKDFFVGERRTNGCREIFAVELPWLESAFGKIVGVDSVSLRQTSLEISFPDSFLVTLKHDTGSVGHFAVNVVSRKAVRDMEVISESLYLRWLGSPDTLSVYDFIEKKDVAVNTYESVEHDARYADNIIENAYVDELAAFFGALRGEDVRRHSFSDDERILAVADEIEGGSRHA